MFLSFRKLGFLPQQLQCWAKSPTYKLSINSTILGFLDVNPETDMVKYTMENDKLIITKSDKKLPKKV